MYFQLENRLFDQWANYNIFRMYIYNDHPMRENPDVVDNYLEYNKYWKRDNFMKIQVLRKMVDFIIFRRGMEKLFQRESIRKFDSWISLCWKPYSLLSQSFDIYNSHVYIVNFGLDVRIS